MHMGLTDQVGCGNSAGITSRDGIGQAALQANHAATGFICLLFRKVFLGLSSE